MSAEPNQPRPNKGDKCKMTHYLKLTFLDCRGEIHYTEALEMLKNIDPPLGFGKKCPDKMAYKRLIRMNMPINKKGRVSFTTTLFALIRDNLKINVRESAEMDQADLELRATIMKMWPITRAGKIDLLGRY